jgi:hypothetical protein
MAKKKKKKAPKPSMWRYFKAFFLRRAVCPFCKQVFHAKKSDTKLLTHKPKKK